jgi:hypothetical protein
MNNGRNNPLKIGDYVRNNLTDASWEFAKVRDMDLLTDELRISICGVSAPFDRRYLSFSRVTKLSDDEAIMLKLKGL